MKNYTLSHPVRLYWGENYAPKPIIVQRAIKKALTESAKMVHQYPGNVQTTVKKALGNIYHVPVSSVIVGNGIEGLLVTLFHTYVKQGDDVITLVPTFSAYGHNAANVGAHIVGIDVGIDTKIRAKQFLSKVTSRTTLMCIASPNTYTGTYHIDKAELRKIVRAFSGVVVIDECYFGIGHQSAISLVKDYSNVLVLRSASKTWGLAGIRLGFGFGSPNIINTLEASSIALAPDPLPTSSYLVLLAVLPYRQQLENAYTSFQNGFLSKLQQVDGIIVHRSYSTYIPVEIGRNIVLSTFIQKMKQYGIELKDTGDLGYILFTVPPRHYWDYILSCFQKCLALL